MRFMTLAAVAALSLAAAACAKPAEKAADESAKATQESAAASASAATASADAATAAAAPAGSEAAGMASEAAGKAAEVAGNHAEKAGDAAKDAGAAAKDATKKYDCYGASAFAPGLFTSGRTQEFKLDDKHSFSWTMSRDLEPIDHAKESRPTRMFRPRRRFVNIIADRCPRSTAAGRASPAPRRCASTLQFPDRVRPIPLSRSPHP